MNKAFQAYILEVSGAKALKKQILIQKLWSDYGDILRIELEGGAYASVVLKLIQIPEKGKHPRGWNTNVGHQRKLKSYQVEEHWYQLYAKGCQLDCKVPECLGLKRIGEEVLIILEDLNASGFPQRKTTVKHAEIKACLHWLANFHANFMHQPPKDLWQIGTYWHLATRPDELKALEDAQLKKAAPIIDQRLNQAEYQTLVHGDAKLANFCFSEDGLKVAAVDFQYVGGGCGMKDVAYFLGSCLTEEELEDQAEGFLNYYFSILKTALSRAAVNFQAVETEWRSLYPFALADFHRFLKGWSPQHWKINSYSERIAREVANECLGFNPPSNS